MESRNAFAKQFEKLKSKENSLRARIAALEFYLDHGDNTNKMWQSLLVEETAEQLALVARSLPIYTGCPNAAEFVTKTIKEEIPVEIGFTAEGWFSLRMPMLLPKKNSGSADYIRSFLYPAMRDFFDGKPPVRYRDAVLIYRHVYDRERPERQMRDHDNLEINMVSDIVAMYVMPDDGPSVCTYYYCSASAEQERTEVYVVPKRDFLTWLLDEPKMPDGGVKLYETR